MDMELEDSVGRQQVDIDTELRDILEDFEGWKWVNFAVSLGYFLFFFVTKNIFFDNIEFT